MKNVSSYIGLIISFVLLLTWIFSLTFAFQWSLLAYHPLSILLFIWMSFLYTGLFITAHDGMHGTIFPRNLKINHLIGGCFAFLFACNWYPLLRKKHTLHHKFPATEEDPDFSPHGFWLWFFSFAKEYINWIQLCGIAILFNLLILVFPEKNVLMFWALPPIVSSLQLFYFGTYLPHRDPPKNKHRARNQKLDHWVAFFSCYFFGYHYEHHDAPHVPWWNLYKKRNERIIEP